MRLSSVAVCSLLVGCAVDDVEVSSIDQAAQVMPERCVDAMTLFDATGLDLGHGIEAAPDTSGAKGVSAWVAEGKAVWFKLDPAVATTKYWVLDDNTNGYSGIPNGATVNLDIYTSCGTQPACSGSATAPEYGLCESTGNFARVTCPDAGTIWWDGAIYTGDGIRLGTNVDATTCYFTLWAFYNPT